MAKKNTRPVQKLTYEELMALPDEEFLNALVNIRIVSPNEWYEKFNCSGSVTGRAAQAFRPREKKASEAFSEGGHE